MLLYFHPWLSNSSKATISKEVLTFMNRSFVLSSCCNIDQNRNYQVPLKIACIKDECLTLSKIISFQQCHIAQHRDAAPYQNSKGLLCIKILKPIPKHRLLIQVGLKSNEQIATGFFTNPSGSAMVMCSSAPQIVLKLQEVNIVLPSIHLAKTCHTQVQTTKSVYITANKMLPTR